MSDEQIPIGFNDVPSTTKPRKKQSNRKPRIPWELRRLKSAALAAGNIIKINEVQSMIDSWKRGDRISQEDIAKLADGILIKSMSRMDALLDSDSVKDDPYKVAAVAGAAAQVKKAAIGEKQAGVGVAIQVNIVQPQMDKDVFDATFREADTKAG